MIINYPTLLPIRMVEFVYYIRYYFLKLFLSCQKVLWISNSNYFKVMMPFSLLVVFLEVWINIEWKGVKKNSIFTIKKSSKVFNDHIPNIQKTRHIIEYNILFLKKHICCIFNSILGIFQYIELFILYNFLMLFFEQWSFIFAFNIVNTFGSDFLEFPINSVKIKSILKHLKVKIKEIQNMKTIILVS